ncbi:MAG: hypothetical protein GXZ07_08700 [Firmicutes bacterium]|nr:hypothetical protein [Bacillota bacterium]
MKKMLVVLLAFLLLGTVSLSGAVAQPQFEQEINVVVNGIRVNFPDARPFINEDSRTMVPIRFIAEELKAKVEWNGEKRLVYMNLAGKQIILGIGNSFAHVNSVKTEFDTAAEIVQDRTMVPLRFIAETFGANVSWNGENKTVTVTTVPEAPPPESSITLFFSDGTGKLVAETRIIRGAKPAPKQVFDELLKGPQTPGLKPTIPAKTEFISGVTESGTLYLNLSSHFISNRPGSPEEETATIYSIVNSMAGLPDIEQVRFMIESEFLDSFFGVDTSVPLEPASL